MVFRALKFHFGIPAAFTITSTINIISIMKCWSERILSEVDNWVRNTMEYVDKRGILYWNRYTNTSKSISRSVYSYFLSSLVRRSGYPGEISISEVDWVLCFVLPFLFPEASCCESFHSVTKLIQFKCCWMQLCWWDKRLDTAARVCILGCWSIVHDPGMAIFAKILTLCHTSNGISWNILLSTNTFLPFWISLPSRTFLSSYRSGYSFLETSFA